MGKKQERFRVYAGGHIRKSTEKCGYCKYAKYMCTFFIHCKKHDKEVTIDKTCSDYTHHPRLTNLEDAIKKAIKKSKTPTLTVGRKRFKLVRIGTSCR